MVVAEQSAAMPVIVPAAPLMPIIGMVVARMGVMVMAAVMARVRPGGSLLRVRMGVLRVVVAIAGRTMRRRGGMVMGVVMAIRAMVVLAFAHGA